MRKKQGRSISKSEAFRDAHKPKVWDVLNKKAITTTMGVIIALAATALVAIVLWLTYSGLMGRIYK